MKAFITGNEAVVRGAVRAGCNFFAGYPITPASSILSGMIRALAETGGQAVQTEDEIAAIGQCIGAAMAGAKALTATSGPGLSLYSENIGLAQMGEVPLVIVDCQRMGPATGGATATGDGDVLFARHVTSGSYPLPVLAATDAASAFRLTYRAFNLAERLRTPVIVLSSKDIALTRQTVELDAMVLPPRVERRLAEASSDYRPYRVDTPEEIPSFAPIGGRQRVRFTGSIHDERGLLTIDRATIDRKLAHLREKIDTRRNEIEDVESDVDVNAETLVISYGAADGAAREAVAQARIAGAAVSQLTLFSLWPLPVRAIRAAVTPRVQRVVMPELNIGLYVDSVRCLLNGLPVESITRVDGGLIHPDTIMRRLCDAAADRSLRGALA